MWGGLRDRRDHVPRPPVRLGGRNRRNQARCPAIRAGRGALLGPQGPHAVPLGDTHPDLEAAEGRTGPAVEVGRGYVGATTDLRRPRLSRGLPVHLRAPEMPRALAV